MTPARRDDVDRSARVGELLREVLAEELERFDDLRLESVAITGVDVDVELSRAIVWIDADEPEPAVEALGRARARLQRAVGRQARIRRTPELIFRVDPSIAQGARIESILRELHEDEAPG